MKKIAILGAGTVGGSCAQILLRDAAVLEKNAGEALELAYVVDLRDMPDAPFHDKMVKDFAVVEADSEVFLVIEAIGGCGAALNFVRRSLEAGKHVVTSNKQLVAEHGTQLLALAKAHGVSFLLSLRRRRHPGAAPLSQCLGANEILEVRGILNGTTNFILTQMLEFGQSYDAALKDAQARGYAEQNPAADVDGIDAGRKICILADMMFGKKRRPRPRLDDGHLHHHGGGRCLCRVGGHEAEASGPRHPSGGADRRVRLAAFCGGRAAAGPGLGRAERHRGARQ